MYSTQIAKHYDRISRFALFFRNFLRNRNFADYTLRKRLLPPHSWKLDHPGEPRSVYTDDLVLSSVVLPPTPKILDAGCGYGATIFRFHERIGGRYDGLTLSPKQLQIATERAKMLDLSESCRFYLANYDDEFAKDQYDAVLAIESLQHSFDLRKTLEVLSKNLKHQGLLIIVDEFILTDKTLGNKDLRKLQSLWHAKYPLLMECEQTLQTNHMDIVKRIDLTDRVRLLPAFAANLALLLSLLLLEPFPMPWHPLISFPVGGLILDRLYRHKHMSYMLIVAQRDNKIEGLKALDKTLPLSPESRNSD